MSRDYVVFCGIHQVEVKRKKEHTGYIKCFVQQLQVLPCWTKENNKLNLVWHLLTNNAKLEWLTDNVF